VGPPDGGVVDYFQLPLSGSRGDKLCGQVSGCGTNFQLPLSGSLDGSTGISDKNRAATFQLPLSGSHEVQVIKYLYNDDNTFNSLSRDHVEPEDGHELLEELSTPSLGIT